MEKLIVSTSPHIKSTATTKKVMLQVIIALCPALIMGVVFFGLYALLIVLLCIGSCLLAEFLYNVIVKKQQTIGDLSSIVTGLILGLNLPPAVPFYVPIVGGIFAIMVVKMLFGGLGKNFANPAATARIFLLLTWAVQMTTFVAPLTYAGNNIFSELTKYFSGIVSTNGLDGMVSSTPLANNSSSMNLLHLFLGNIGGCIGETSALALIIGGVYLCIMRIVDWKIPVIYIGSFAIFTLVFTGSYLEILPQLLSGGLMIGAFFMASDYATSPNTKCGTIIYALGLGFITVLLRQLTSMPEGVSYAIVIMNLIVPLLDKYIIPHPFGSKKKPVLLYSLLGVMCALIITFLAMLPVSMSKINAIGKINELSISGNVYTYDVTGYEGYMGKDNENKGYVTLLVKVKDFEIIEIEVTDHDQSPPSYNAAFKDDYKYVKSFIGRDLRHFRLGKNTDASVSATYTSNAIMNALTKVYSSHLAGGRIS